MYCGSRKSFLSSDVAVADAEAPVDFRLPFLKIYVQWKRTASGFFYPMNQSTIFCDNARNSTQFRAALSARYSIFARRAATRRGEMDESEPKRRRTSDSDEWDLDTTENASFEAILATMDTGEEEESAK